MPSPLLRTLLFLSSYAPVFVIFAVRFQGRNCAVFIASLTLLACGLLGVVGLLISIARTDPDAVFVGDVEVRDADLAGYLVGYLLPFISLGADDWRDAVALGLFFATLAIVYVNSRMIYVNPLLALFGYHLLRVRETTDPQVREPSAMRYSFLISRKDRPRTGRPVYARRVMTDLLWSLPSDERRGS